MIKGIIFDFFGVFCPDISGDWFEKSVKGHASMLGDFQEICTRSDFGLLTKSEFFKELSQLTNVPANEIIKGIEAEVKIDSDLVEYVKKLHQKGYKIACLSNGTHEWTLHVINRFEIANIFDAIVLSGDLKIVKPDPRIYYHALKELSLTADEAVFVDDREINTKAAKKIGITPIVYSSFDKFKTDFESIVTA